MEVQEKAPPQPTPTSTPTASRGRNWINTAIRFADEGVPIRAIVRSMLVPYDEIREALNAAIETGTLLTMPRDDWPPGTRRDERQPDTIPLEYADDHMLMLAMRAFNFTPAEARMFIALLRRPQATKGMLHTASQRLEPVASSEEVSEPKIVDVFICKMRKKLRARGVPIKIDTIWGRGYALSLASKTEAHKLMGIANTNITTSTNGDTDEPS